MEITDPKLKMMILKIYDLERKNAEALKPKSFQTMVAEIQKIIEGELKK